MEYTTYKQRLRPSIVEEAGRRFRQYGIKAVRMDDIAKGLSISKRTVYELYSTKEDILVDVLKKRHEDSRTHMRDFINESDSTMDILIEVLRVQLDSAAHTHADFFRDIETYPKASALLQSFSQAQKESSAIFFQKGIEEGYFLSNINYAIMEKIMAESIRTIRTNKEFKELSYKDLFMSFLYVLLRGICTVKGVECIDAFANKMFKED